MECGKIRTNALPFMFTAMTDSVVSSVNITEPSAPAPVDAMHVHDMVVVEIKPFISFPVQSVQYPKAIVLKRPLKK